MTVGQSGILVSVVIPCYNTHHYLDRTLASLWEQSIAEAMEVIVVDDGSTDPATIEALLSLGGDVTLIRQENAGLPAARNAGIAKAQGEYVLPLDSDDWLGPETVEKLCRALQSKPESGFAFTYLQLEGEAHGVLRSTYNFFEQLFVNRAPYCLLMRKSLWAELGGYDETMRRGYEDWEFNIRLGKHGYFGIVVPEPLFHYQVRRTGMLISQSNRIHGELWGAIQDRHRDLYRLSTILRLWSVWRHKVSTYPLSLYFPWLLLYRVLPAAVFLRVFKRLRWYSQAQRMTRSYKRTHG